jgi:hypothetical protein
LQVGGEKRRACGENRGGSGEKVQNGGEKVKNCGENEFYHSIIDQLKSA